MLIAPNVAGELLCQWTEKDDTEGSYSPGNTIENILGEIEPSDDCLRKQIVMPPPICEHETEGLFVRFQGDNNDTTAKGGERAFLNDPLPREEVDALAKDNEGMVLCPLNLIKYCLTVYVVMPGCRVWLQGPRRV
eukprot:GHVR01026872.1.p2 GENE.GHVR01026872.1~~GHVR01026872.1.p2  ORF type:complete len:135 (-),score=14.34 GHVR01026872.1:403-807(-)